MSPMLRNVLICGAVAFIAWVMLSAAVAQSLICGPRDAILKALETKFRETPAGQGLSGSGTMFELTLSDRGSWSILASRPDGMSCVVASGQGWEQDRIPGVDS